ncbi:MAG: hypothetical protein PVJ55_02935 [Anaerolineae bacterium]|jgi:hypothetical protein
MERKFNVLRIIGTLWKVLAWITLVGGILLSVGVLLIGVLGSGGFLLRLLGEESAAIPGAMGIVSSILGFLVTLAGAVIYFLILYAVGDLIYLLLAIEENTRQTMRSLQQEISPEPETQESLQAPPA